MRSVTLALCVLASCAPDAAAPAAGDVEGRLLLEPWQGAREVVVYATPGVRLDVPSARPTPARGQWIARLTLPEARAVAALDGVRAIGAMPDVAPLPLHDTMRVVTGAEAVQGFSVVDEAAVYAGYSGAGITLAVFDGGRVAPHVDFGDRVLNPSTTGDSHATLVAGTLAGDGTASVDHGGTPYQWRGMAPEAELLSRSGASDFMDAPVLGQHLFVHGVDASNTSLALTTRGEYSALSAAIDGAVRGDVVGRPFPSVIAAANNGLSAQYGVLRGYYSVLSNTKNALTVGAMLANEDHRWRGSSMGPTWDGRVIPQVMAPSDWLTWPALGRPVEIDYVRFVDDGGEVGVALEFDDPADADGWRRVQNTSPFEVVDGRLSFVSEIVGIAISPDNLGVDARYHWLEVRMAVFEPADPASKGALFEVGTAPYAGSVWAASARSAWRAAAADGVWETHRVDLGTTGPFEWLRIRPYDGSSRALYGPSWDTTVGDVRAYEEHGQTSSAAPVATGGVALLLQALDETSGRDTEREPFLSSTVRALVVDSAVDLVHPSPWVVDGNLSDTGRPVTYGVGPDWATGYGRLDVAAAVAAAEAGHWREDAVREGDTRVFAVSVPDGTEHLSVTLAWDDPPADPLAAWDAPKLVHDLDLRVTDGVGLEVLPWTLEPPPHEALPSENGVHRLEDLDLLPAARAENHRDNLEKVEIDNPPAGVLRVEVRAAEVLAEGPWQRFSLAASLGIDDPAACVASSEQCNGVDDDCDGSVDEALAGEVESCDGLDNDCDGSIDEGCECVRDRPCWDAQLGCPGEQVCTRWELGTCVPEPGCPPPEDTGDTDVDTDVDTGDPETPAGCGCDAGRGAAGWVGWLVLGLGLLSGRRQR